VLIMVQGEEEAQAQVEAAARELMPSMRCHQGPASAARAAWASALETLMGLGEEAAAAMEAA
jgi:hypothetical protein